MLRLTHSPPLNVLRDAASELPLEAALELRLAHAGDARKALERDIKGVVVGNVADHVLQPLRVCRRQGALPPLTLPLPCVHHQRDGLRDLGLIEQCRGRSIAAIVLYLKQQL